MAENFRFKRISELPAAEEVDLSDILLVLKKDGSSYTTKRVPASVVENFVKQNSNVSVSNLANVVPSDRITNQKEAAAFLKNTTFGPTMTEINDLVSLGSKRDWILNQISSSYDNSFYSEWNGTTTAPGINSGWLGKLTMQMLPPADVTFTGTTNGTTTISSVTNATTIGLSAGMTVTSTSGSITIPANTTIVSVTGTDVTLSSAITGSASGISFTAKFWNTGDDFNRTYPGYYHTRKTILTSLIRNNPSKGGVGHTTDYTFTATANGTTSLTSVSSTAGLAVGMYLSTTSTSVFFPDDVYITAISGTTITISSAIIGSGTGVTFSAARKDPRKSLLTKATWALSKLIPVSIPGGGFDEEADTLVIMNWYNTLARHAFGNYADLLEDVAYNISMSLMLTHLRNQKSDGTGRQPDENFGREIMQLFSIGLYGLNIDGTYQYDQNGNKIENYTGADILEISKVFTGLTRWERPTAEYYTDSTTVRNTMLGGGVGLEGMSRTGFLTANQAIYGIKKPAQYIKKGYTYRIYTAGTTDFTKFGAANNNVAVSFTATANGTTSLTSASTTTGLSTGMVLSSVSTSITIPANTTITNISGTTITLSQAITGSGSGISFTAGTEFIAAKNGDAFSGTGEIEEKRVYPEGVIPRLKHYTPWYETGAKNLPNVGINIPANTDPETNIRMMCEGLVNHPSCAPNICKNLIKLTVTSNPSREYVARVASVFKNNGKNVAGDMSAVWLAIFTDPEANLDTASSTSKGRIIEGFEAWAKLLRCFDATNRYSGYTTTDNSVTSKEQATHFDGAITGTSTTPTVGYIADSEQSRIGVWPYSSPSVFSYYSLEYTITPAIDWGILTPELGALPANVLMNTFNALDDTSVNGDPVAWAANPSTNSRPYIPSFSDVLGDLTDVNNIINKLDLLLCGGTLGRGKKKLLNNTLNGMVSSTSTERDYRVSVAIQLIVRSPEFWVS